MVLIGTLELLCLLAFPAGAIWLIVNLFRKKSKKKPVFTMILKFRHTPVISFRYRKTPGKH